MAFPIRLRTLLERHIGTLQERRIRLTTATLSQRSRPCPEPIRHKQKPETNTQGWTHTHTRTQRNCATSAVKRSLQAHRASVVLRVGFCIFVDGIACVSSEEVEPEWRCRAPHAFSITSPKYPSRTSQRSLASCTSPTVSMICLVIETHT